MISPGLYYWTYAPANAITVNSFMYVNTPMAANKNRVLQIIFAPHQKYLICIRQKSEVSGEWSTFTLDI